MEPTIEDLADELKLMNNAVLESERVAGEALGQLRLVEDQLAAARADQASWDAVMRNAEAELAHARNVHQELEAIKNSRSWRLIWFAMSPYRWLRSRVDRSARG